MDAQQLPIQPIMAPQHATVPLVAPQPALNRDSFNAKSLGRRTNALVKQARVLMVGAGGIGCELLKNLVLSGFGEIHVVDLDTIDLSNLNRQFLFRREHIKKSKALVAKEAAQNFNPNVKIIAYHANIKEDQFNIAWFKSFKVVFNALDNMDARRYVNKMCLAADVPLIESGTAGFKGQVQVIKKGVTACYDCTPKEAPKSFPVCTIRSTPSQPIHCIVWGKSYLLNEIFGASEDESAFDNSLDEDNAQEIEELKREAGELRKIRQSVGTDEFSRMLFEKVFHADIERLRSMKDMWKSRKPPEPLDYDDLLKKAGNLGLSADAILGEGHQAGQKVWSLEENFAVLNDSLKRLSKRMLELKEPYDGSGAEPIITFDKDDDDTLDFVAASANIRSTVFGIDRKSRFDIKQMAGNIIPAIATTNAVVGGLIVLESLKVLRGEYNKVKEVFLTPTGEQRQLGPDRLAEPNPDCPVCSVYYTTAHVDFARATLNDLVEDFLKLDLGYGEKEISISNDIGILYDPDETENLEKKLSELGIKEDSFLTVIDDDDDEPFVNVVLNIQKAKEPLGEKSVQAPPSDRQPEIPHKPKKAAVTNGHAPVANGVAPAGDAPTDVASLKRRRPDESAEALPAKRARTAGTGPTDSHEVVVVEDDDGRIVIADD